MQSYTVYFIRKLLYMFWVVPSPIIRSANNYLQHLVFVTPLLLSAAIVEELVVPSPIIRSANNCIYSIWYLSHRYCYLPLS